MKSIKNVNWRRRGRRGREKKIDKRMMIMWRQRQARGEGWRDRGMRKMSKERAARGREGRKELISL